MKIKKEADWIDDGENCYREPAIGVCDVCGLDVVLDGWACTCDCGADYNSSGQRLSPREQWGEETGEHWTDVLNLSGEDY